MTAMTPWPALSLWARRSRAQPLRVQIGVRSAQWWLGRKPAQGLASPHADGSSGSTHASLLGSLERADGSLGDWVAQVADALNRWVATGPRPSACGPCQILWAGSLAPLVQLHGVGALKPASASALAVTAMNAVWPHEEIVCPEPLVEPCTGYDDMLAWGIVPAWLQAFGALRQEHGIAVTHHSWLDGLWMQTRLSPEASSGSWRFAADDFVVHSAWALDTRLPAWARWLGLRHRRTLPHHLVLGPTLPRHWMIDEGGVLRPNSEAQQLLAQVLDAHRSPAPRPPKVGHERVPPDAATAAG